MAQSILATGDSYKYDKSLETYSLIWLDGDMDDKKKVHTEHQLRTMINHVQRFKDGEKCLQYINQRLDDDRMVLLLSGELAPQVIPYIHELIQVSSIYVYSMEKKKTEQWTCKFTKVKLQGANAERLINKHLIIEVDRNMLSFSMMQNK